MYFIYAQISYSMQPATSVVDQAMNALCLNSLLQYFIWTTRMKGFNTFRAFQGQGNKLRYSNYLESQLARAREVGYEQA